MMKRFVAFVAMLVCLVTCVCAQVRFSDIAKWGLLRKNDLSPSGASISYGTNGVLQAVERKNSVDTNTLMLFVITNLVYSTGEIALTNGTYTFESSGLDLGDGTGEKWAHTINGVYWRFSSLLNGITLKSDTWKGTNTLDNYDQTFVPLETWGNASPFNTFPMTLVGVHPTTNPPSGCAVIDYRRYVSVVTNEFVSSEKLQDAIDDLRQEISDAIEAHVQLLHSGD